MKTDDSRFTTLKFIAIAVVFMVLVDQFMFGGTRDYIEDARQEYYAEKVIEAEVKDLPPPVKVMPETGDEYFEHKPEETPAETPAEKPASEKEETAAVIPQDIQPAPYKGKARVAIIIDDLGMDIKRSRRIVEMKAPLTLAFLPYGTKTKELAKLGKENGHSLIIHTPMEATDGTQNIGPMGLRTGMSQEAFDKSFGDILASFEGYEGINNHMGSRLTQDSTAMTHLMQLLKDHNLFFVDSRTINKSVAAEKAKEAGIPYATRDVFLDHQDTIEFVRNALKQTERLALRRGTAIAIGHPRDATIQGLREWIPTLEAKGIEIVPVKDLLTTPTHAVIPSVVEGAEKVETSAGPDPSAPAAPAASGQDGSGESDGALPMVSVTLPDGTEQLIHLPQQ